MSQTIIGLKELRENTETYIKRASLGHTFMVMRRSRPVFKIVPPEDDDESGWETVIDFTKIRKGGVPTSEILEAMASMRKRDGSNKKGSS